MNPSIALSIFLLGLAFPWGTKAQGADDCVDADTLTYPGTTAVSSLDSATHDPSGDDLNCDIDEEATPNIRENRWFTFVPSVSGTLTLDMCGGDPFSNDPVVMAVFEGDDCTSLTCVDNAESEDLCPPILLSKSFLVVPVTSGVRYFLRIQGFSTTSYENIPYELVTTFETTPTGSGDPYFKTLDGLKVKYDGPCSYVLMTNVCPWTWNGHLGVKQISADSEDNIPNFAIVAHHGRPNKRRRRIVNIDSFSVHIDHHVLKVTRGNTMQVDGVVVGNLPFQNKFMSVTNYTHFNERKQETYDEYVVKLAFGLEFMVSRSGTGMLWITQLPKNLRTCGLLGNKDGDKKNDLALRNGTVLMSSNTEELLQHVIQVGDDWMMPTSFQPLQCDWFPLNSYAASQTCQYDEHLVDEICDTTVRRYMKTFSGEEIEQCFASVEKDGVDATRLYDDCITQLCRDPACVGKSIVECVPTIALNLFKNGCADHGVERRFPKLNFGKIVVDAKAVLAKQASK